MVLHKSTGEIEHKLFKDIIDYFGKGDTFVLNDTKVFPARLYGNKAFPLLKEVKDINFVGNIEGHDLL